MARRVRLGVVAALAAASLALVPALVSGQARTVNITLSGANEVPPVTTSATGTFTGTLDVNSLRWSLSVSGMIVTAAHIHQGAAGANGPIVANLVIAPSGTFFRGITSSGSITERDLVGPLSGNFAGFVEAFNTGNLYVNVHSPLNPGGEIRGQLSTATTQAQATATPTATPRPATPAPTAAAPAATPVATPRPATPTAAAPAAPRTGTAGIADGESSSAAAVLLLALAVAVVAGGRTLVLRRR